MWLWWNSAVLSYVAHVDGFGNWSTMSADLPGFFLCCRVLIRNSKLSFFALLLEILEAAVSCADVDETR